MSYIAVLFLVLDVIASFFVLGFREDGDDIHSSLG